MQSFDIMHGVSQTVRRQTIVGFLSTLSRTPYILLLAFLFCFNHPYRKRSTANVYQRGESKASDSHAIYVLLFLID